MKHYIKASLLMAGVAVLASATLRAGPPSENDVGDPDSFKHGANYLGASSGSVVMDTSCPGPSATPSPAPNNNGNQCFVMSACPMADPVFDANNIAAIKLPKDATKDIIYPVLNFFQSYTLQNTSGSPQSSVFIDYGADITIESDALNDPSCIDPSTSATCGGKLTMQFTDSHFREDRSMNPGDRERQRLNYTHAGNLGITKRFLVEQEGIPQTVADNLFHSAMTIRLNAHIRTKCVDPGAIITFNMRLFGD